MDGVECDNTPGKIEFCQQPLSVWDFVGFLTDFDVGGSERPLDRKGAQYLFGSTTVKGVKAVAQDLAIDRESPARARGGVLAALNLRHGIGKLPRHRRHRDC